LKPLCPLAPSHFLTLTDLEAEPVVEVEPVVVAVGEPVPSEFGLHDERLDHEGAFQRQLVVSVS